MKINQAEYIKLVTENIKIVRKGLTHLKNKNESKKSLEDLIESKQELKKEIERIKALINYSSK